MSRTPVRARAAKAPAKPSPPAKSKAVKVAITPPPRAPIPEPPELEAVSINATFPDGLKVIARTNAALHLITGRLESEDETPGKKVLVPFAEMRIGGARVDDIDESFDPDQSETLHTSTVSLENMAYMVLDLATDLRRLCAETTQLSQGDLAIDPVRMAHVRYFVAHLERQARICRLSLDKCYGPPEDASAPS